MRYGATVFLDASKDATNVINRVPLLMRLSKVGHELGAVVWEVGVYA